MARKACGRVRQKSQKSANQNSKKKKKKKKKKKMDAEKKFHALGAVDIIVIVVFVLASVFVGLWAGNNVKRKKRAGSGGWRRIESGDDDEEDSHDDRDDPENVVAVRHANGRHVSSMHSKTISSNESNGEASDEYFTAGRRQHCCIVSMSLLSGLQSGISFLGGPGLSYSRGFLQVFLQLGSLLTLPFLAFFLIPFFYSTGTTSIYAYLEKRYGRTLRVLIATIFVVKVILYLSIVLLAPAIAMSSVTDVNEQYMIVICGTLSTLYVSKGGMASVIWTDFMQSIALLVVLFGALLSCSLKIDKPLNYHLSESSSWNFGWASDITVWSALSAGFFGAAAQYGADQIAVQRYLSVSSIAEARKSTIISMLLSQTAAVAQAFLGMVLATFYLGQKLPVADDGVLPYYVAMEMPSGSTGCLLAALFGCTMSVMGGGLNSAAAVISIDIAPFACTTAGRLRSARQRVQFSRRVTFILGIAVTSITVLLSLLGGELISLSTSILGAMGGPVLGIFLLGIFSEVTSHKGAICALIVATMTNIAVAVSHAAESSSILRVSPFWIPGLLTLLTMGVAFLSSAFVFHRGTGHKYKSSQTEEEEDEEEGEEGDGERGE